MNSDRQISEIATKINNISDGVISFLQHQKIGDTGRYHYTYSGDLYEPSELYGVEASTFALKLYYALGERVDKTDVLNAIGNVKSFVQSDGYIYDPLVNQLVKKHNWKQNLKAFIKQGDPRELTNIRYKRAESRQGHSAMLLFGEHPEVFPTDISISSSEIIKLLKRFDWRYPWAAGSHFSHMMFYLNLAYEMRMISVGEFDRARLELYDWINLMQSKEDGSWYLRNATAQERINGAMKVITGFYAAGIKRFEYSRQLIDLCLANINNEQACDNFNIIYVLHKASINEPEYRRKEIVDFASERFKIYMNYYHPEQGGFSFYPGKAEENYYGAIISRGYDEADIHGTTMFVWGLSIISKLLGIEKEVGLYEFLA